MRKLLLPVVPAYSKGLMMARKAYVPKRRTDAAFETWELADFMAGEWVQCSSSHIAAARYLPEKEQLHIRWKGGKEGYYDGVDEIEAREFGLAPSKGGYKVDHLLAGKKWVYT